MDVLIQLGGVAAVIASVVSIFLMFKTRRKLIAEASEREAKAASNYADAAEKLAALCSTLTRDLETTRVALKGTEGKLEELRKENHQLDTKVDQLVEMLRRLDYQLRAHGLSPVVNISDVLDDDEDSGV